MAKKITNIPAISKIEYLNTTDKNFKNPETIAIMSCYIDDKFKSFEISSLDFETGIIESKDGQLYQTDDYDKLSELANQLNKTLSAERPEITVYDQEQDKINEINIQDNSITIYTENTSENFRIVNMYYDIVTDNENNVIQSKISEKQEELEILRENPEANREQIEKIIESTNLASANVAEEGDKSLNLFKSAEMTLILKDKSTGEYKQISLEDLTYSELKNMTGFTSPNTQTPDTELVEKLEEIKRNVSKKNNFHVYNSSEDIIEAKKIDNLSIENGKISGTYEERKISFPIKDVDASCSKYGLILSVSENGQESEYIVTGVSKNFPAKSTESVFNTICDAKNIAVISDMTMSNEHSKVLSEVSSLDVGIQYLWENGSNYPKAQYTLAGQEMSSEELVNNVYASETNGFVAIRIGYDTKILSTPDSSLEKTSKLLYDIRATDDGYVGTLDINKKDVKLDYIDTQNGIAISEGTVYVFNGKDEKISIIGSDSSFEGTYINNESNEIENIINSSSITKNTNIINDWDIVSDKNKLYIAKISPVLDENGNVKSKEVEKQGEIKSIELTDEGMLKVRFAGKGNRFEGGGWVQLGKPSEVSSEESVYQEKTPDGQIRHVSMDEAIYRSHDGINTIIKQVNENIDVQHNEYTLITNPKELVRDVPEECFVVVNNKLYYKEGDNLYSNSETLNYENVRNEIDVAFSAPTTQEVALLNKLSNEELYVNGSEFRDLEKIEILSKEGYEELKSGKNIEEIEKIEVDTIASYEKELAHSDDVSTVIELS